MAIFRDPEFPELIHIYHLEKGGLLKFIGEKTYVISALLVNQSNHFHLQLINASFVMLAKVERAMPLRQICLKSYLSHQYQCMIECAAIVICLIQKKLKSQTKNQFGKQTA